MSKFLLHFCWGVLVGSTSLATLLWKTSFEQNNYLEIVGISALLFMICILGGLLPDIDHEDAWIRRFLALTTAGTLGFLLYIRGLWTGSVVAFLVSFWILSEANLTKHRGHWHSVVVAVGYGVIVFFFMGWLGVEWNLLAGFFAFVSVMSHLILDGCVKLW